MRICVYGAASPSIDAEYIAKVEELGKIMAKRGHSLVFGGGKNGLMGAVARGVHDNGGEILGVIPTFFIEQSAEVLYEHCDKVVETETMRERKQIMEDNADAFIVVPGGIGTYEEFFEILTSKQLCRHNKPIAIYNVLGFYENTFTESTEAGEISLKREIPDLDFICECNYRLWGVHGNTIYGSKYSDPFNFQAFDGLSGDSYYIDVATEGAFTGCIPYSGHICFFKENTLHKLYGSKPSNFQLVTARVAGVQAGSERSMCIINETLFYKGVGGVYAYTGGVPELVSEKFGTRRFSDACAATDGSRYYISMQGEDGWQLLTYDVKRGIWLREDGLHCVDMTQHEGAVYLLAEDGKLYRIDPEAERGDIPWSVTFCPFSEP